MRRSIVTICVVVLAFTMVYICEHCQFHAETKRNLSIHITKGCTAHLQDDSSLENALERAKAKKRRKREQKERQAKHRRLHDPSAGEPSDMVGLDRDEGWEDIGEEGAHGVSLLSL